MEGNSLVAILFGLNEWLEGIGMEKARRSMEALLKVAPSEAIKLKDGIEFLVPIAELQRGDLVIVKPGGKIPSDGIVEDGRSSVNEAAITGESMPLRNHLARLSMEEQSITRVLFGCEFVKPMQIPRLLLSCI